MNKTNKADVGNNNIYKENDTINVTNTANTTDVASATSTINTIANATANTISNATNTADICRASDANTSNS